MNRSYYSNRSPPGSSDQLSMSSFSEEGVSPPHPTSSSSSSSSSSYGYSFTKGAVQERNNLNVTVQSGIPENSVLIFNVHICNQSANSTEWEVSYNYYQFGKLDWLVCSQESSFKEIFFPMLENDVVALLAAGKGSNEKLQKLSRCQLLLQNWIHELIDRSASFPPAARDIVYKFFSLPTGPLPGQPPFEFPKMSTLKSLGRNGGSSVVSSTLSGSRFGGTASTYSGTASITSNSNNTYDNSGSSNNNSSVTSGNQKNGNVLNRAGYGSNISTTSSGGTMNSGLAAKKKKGIFAKAFALGMDRSKTTTNPSANIQLGRVEEEDRLQRVTSHMKETLLPLIRLRVQRGGVESLRGYVEYEVQIFYSYQHRPYRTIDRYDAFRQLQDDLAMPGKTPASAAFIALSKFPPKANSFLFGCTEQELSERTRLLDRWLREVCCCYKLMGDRNRLLVRNFLCFDMSNDLEIYLQDKMMNGQIESPRAEIFVPPTYEGAVTMPNPQNVSRGAMNGSPVDTGDDSAIDDERNGTNNIPQGLLVQKKHKGKGGKRWSLFGGNKSSSSLGSSPSRGNDNDNGVEVPALVFTVVNKKHWREFKVGEWNAEGSQNIFGFDDSGVARQGSNGRMDRGGEKGCDVTSMKDDCTIM